MTTQKKTIKTPATKRDCRVFDTVNALALEDEHAEAKRRKRSSQVLEQSQAAQSQSSLYESLVECRILFQRSLTPVSNATKLSGPPSLTGVNFEHALWQCDQLLSQLMEARRILTAPGIEKPPNYASLLENNNTDAIALLLQSEYENCRENWKDVLNKRHNDVKLHSGLKSKSSYKIFDSTFWQQVESVVQHETNQKQMSHHLSSMSSSSLAHSSSSPAADTDCETGNDALIGHRLIFDDSKIYQQLLKDFLSSHSSSNSSLGLLDASRGFLSRASCKSTLANVNGTKPLVDRKASKGRKIRYHDIPKLQNFTFPIAKNRLSHSSLDEDEWFQSLLGGFATTAKKSGS